MVGLLTVTTGLGLTTIGTVALVEQLPIVAVMVYVPEFAGDAFNITGFCSELA
jgi:hypothetical protein